ncbi:MAG: DUF6206 family protein [Desulfobacterales bacterium]
MKTDPDLLFRFEKGLNPQNLESSSIQATCIGYGEISAIFVIEGNQDIAYKRLPLFKSRNEAEAYRLIYHEYCELLKKAGLRLPEDETSIVEVPGRPVVLYIAQRKLPGDRLCHNLLHTLDSDSIKVMIQEVVSETEKVWEFNRTYGPSLRLAIDGQLSNWAWIKENEDHLLYFIDTSTPLYRKEGVEKQNPELLLQSAPGFLRWMIRMFFLEDVMTRYYDPILVNTDLAGNLFKEQKPELVPLALEIINSSIRDNEKKITFKDIEKYYREDKLIWTLFLSFRKIDRWIKTALLGKRYEFILPGKIKR